mgnify:CR=1 FL=1
MNDTGYGYGYTLGPSLVPPIYLCGQLRPRASRVDIHALSRDFAKDERASCLPRRSIKYIKIFTESLPRANHVHRAGPCTKPTHDMHLKAQCGATEV